MNKNRILKDIDNAKTLSNDIDINFKNKRNVFIIFFCNFFFAIFFEI